MQPKFIVTATKLHKLLVATSPESRFLAIRCCRTDSGTAETQTADPKTRNEKPEPQAYPGDEVADQVSKSPILKSNPTIKQSPVNPLPDPFAQQKRSNSTSTSVAAEKQREDVICVGFDGSPWPEDEKGGIDRGSSRKEAEDDDKEYFKHHKASPLSEMEMAETRKPITMATDGSADSKHGDYGGGGVVVWRPEQIDTAEDSLRRAMEIWKQNAMRGDPDSPHGRVLRELRGEYW